MASTVQSPTSTKPSPLPASALLDGVQVPVAQSAAAAIEPGYRLVPARFGKPGQQADAWVQCPTWCTEDHVDHWNQHPVDLSHWGGEDARWDVASIPNPLQALLALSARLYADPANQDDRMRAAHVRMDDESIDVFLTPEMAEETADELIAFAAQLRHLARQARQFNEQTSQPRRLAETLPEEAQA
ncbi:hypothetical protein TPA0906_34470 [Streptomyces olivaceus]|uniref:DUF6907 domain-containing protein n=1 Tax=Streptomyces olivaceus TaxID=47716 RepID=UPI0022EDF113|nr:hypothetical protein [Streptomyces olivaceus]GHJ01582.1 hypothetical protein TPA0906_34470 [Streptomyces olivaceus]